MMMPLTPLSLCHKQPRHRKHANHEEERSPINISSESEIIRSRVQTNFVDSGAHQNRKQSLDGMDSDADDKLVDESNIESLVKDLPQATDRTVQFLDNLLAVLPNRYLLLFFVTFYD